MKTSLVIACIFSLIFFIAPASAVEVSVVPLQVETDVNQQAWYTININNNRFLADDFVITVLGPHLEWLNLESYYVTLNAYENKDIGMYFYPSIENSYQYEVVAYSRSNNENTDSQTITLNVVPEKKIKILEFTSKKTGGEVEIYLKLSAKNSMTLEIPFDITYEDGSLIKHAEVTKEVEGITEINTAIPVGDLLAGDYEVKVSIPELSVEAESGFNVAPLHRILTKREEVSTPFGQQVVITVTNEGNAAEDYTAADSVKASQYVDFVDAPASTYVQGNDVTYNWRIEGLAVGKSVSFTYNISRLPFLAGSFVAVFCVVALVGMGAVKVRTPDIRKKYVKKTNGHLIILEIKGSLTSDLRNVIVKDRVTPLGKVLPEFGGPKPVIRESEYGTELIWSLGDIKPRSEIYLSYAIHPLVEAQLKMPRAYLTYKTGEGEGKVKVFSREVILE